MTLILKAAFARARYVLNRTSVIFRHAAGAGASILTE
jgi:hypothetical protein